MVFSSPRPFWSPRRPFPAQVWLAQHHPELVKAPAPLVPPNNPYAPRRPFPAKAWLERRSAAPASRRPEAPRQNASGNGGAASPRPPAPQWAVRRRRWWWL